MDFKNLTEHLGAIYKDTVANLYNGKEKKSKALPNTDKKAMRTRKASLDAEPYMNTTETTTALRTNYNMSSRRETSITAMGMQQNDSIDIIVKTGKEMSHPLVNYTSQ